jgi:CBS domain containing-hemolysin-like protein
MVTEEELRLLVQVSEEQGILLEEEKEMIHGVFEFGDTLVREVMRPRIDVVAVDANDPFEEVLKAALEAGHSRIPVYEDNIDNIIGVLYVKDLLRYLLPENRPVNLRDLARPAFFVPESQKVAQVFHQMRSKKTHKAIVSDEYGGTAGIVTIEDLLEEIVGEIQDEYDTEPPPVQPEGNHRFVVDGGVTIGTINELLHLDLESDAYDTIGGLVYSQLGAEPAEGASAVVGGLKATVVEMGGRRVRRVRVERVGDGAAANGAAQESQP